MKIMKMEVLIFLETSFMLFRDVIYVLVIGHLSYQMPMMCMTRNQRFLFFISSSFSFCLSVRTECRCSVGRIPAA